VLIELGRSQVGKTEMKMEMEAEKEEEKYILIFCFFSNILILYPKIAPCPEAAAQTTTATAADQAADHAKPLSLYGLGFD